MYAPQGLHRGGKINPQSGRLRMNTRIRFAFVLVLAFGMGTTICTAADEAHRGYTGRVSS